MAKKVWISRSLESPDCHAGRLMALCCEERQLAVAWVKAPIDADWGGAGRAFLGPRLRATRTRILSIISAGEEAPFGRKTSAWRARSKALTVPETIIAGKPG